MLSIQQLIQALMLLHQEPHRALENSGHLQSGGRSAWYTLSTGQAGVPRSTAAFQVGPWQWLSASSAS